MSVIKPKILITGATGFVGKAVTKTLLSLNYHVVATVRSEKNSLPLGLQKIIVDNLSATTNWSSAFETVSVVIHSAARAHVMSDTATNPAAEFCKVNTDGTLRLARQAAKAGVKRFIFISSIKVNGEKTKPDNPFRPDSNFISKDPYGLSKYNAERGLLALAQEMEMEVVIIRPPLVYGPGVQANFASMMGWIKKGRLLPLGTAVHNKRSLIALENLVNFIIHCIDHPKAANEIFLISDGEDVSTSELIRKVAKAFNKKILLLPVPITWMKFIAKLINKEEMINRLFDSLQVDSSKARDLLGWKPIISMDDQLKITADAYLNEKTV